MKNYAAVALLSGGLDSILAARLIQNQGLNVLCLHFMTPFFGKPEKISHWRNIYKLDIRAIDVGEEYIAILRQGPVHGYGSALNPCVDCKIFMMRQARLIMDEVGASFIISGEVLGQRPMSQRRDTLNIISRDGDVRDILLRPLCAQHMTPTRAETSGLVKRELLPGFSGRGRKDQLDLAAQMGIAEIPTPGGGCVLTEKENVRRYWPLLKNIPAPDAADFKLANVGRQFWAEDYWLSIGRNQSDNATFEKLLKPGDILLKTAAFPGPLALCRKIEKIVAPDFGKESGPEADKGLGKWDTAHLLEAAALVASYSPKACQASEQGWAIKVQVRQNLGQIRQQHDLQVVPGRQTRFTEPKWENAHQELCALRKKRAAPTGTAL